MTGSRPPSTIHPPAGPRPRRTRLLRGGAVVGVLALAIGGGYWYRESQRADEREELLRLSRDFRFNTIATLERHLASHPDDADALQALVQQQLRHGADLAKVEPNLTRLIALRPDDPEPVRVRFGPCARSGRDAEALEDALRVIELDPADVAFHAQVAHLAIKMGRYDRTMASLRHLVEAQPEARREWGAILALALLESGDAAAAQETLDRYVPAGQDVPPSHLVRGKLHLAANRPAEAVEWLRRAAERPQDRAIALYHLAAAHRAAGDDAAAEAAVKELEAVKQRELLIAEAGANRGDLPLQVRAARALLQDGRANEAAVLLEEAIRRHGEHPSVHEPLAEAYTKLGRTDLADAWRGARK